MVVMNGINDVRRRRRRVSACGGNFHRDVLQYLLSWLAACCNISHERLACDAAWYGAEPGTDCWAADSDAQVILGARRRSQQLSHMSGV